MGNALLSMSFRWLSRIVIASGCLSAIAFAQDSQLSPSTTPSIAVEISPTNRTGWPGLQPDKTILLPNGWSLSPQGKQIAVGDFPARPRRSCSF